MNELKVSLNKVIKVSQETAFNASLNPTTLSKFMMPMPK